MTRVSNLARRIDLTSLQLFVALSETGSISKAAERESISVSAASKRLTDIESTLRTPLLYRHARGITLTPAGETFLHHARLILRNLDEMQGHLSEFADGVRGHVRVHAALATIVQFLTDDLGEFTHKYPEIKVNLEEHLSTDVIRAVQDGAADLGICNSIGVPDELERTPYRQDKLVLVVPKSHLLSGRSAIAFDECLDYEHVELHSDSAISKSIHRAAASSGSRIKTRVRVTGPDVMCHMVRIGLGVGVMPLRAYELASSASELKSILLTDDWATREIELVARNLASLPVPAKLLIEHLSPGALAVRNVHAEDISLKAAS